MEYRPYIMEEADMLINRVVRNIQGDKFSICGARLESGTVIFEIGNSREVTASSLLQNYRFLRDGNICGMPKFLDVKKECAFCDNLEMNKGVATCFKYNEVLKKDRYLNLVKAKSCDGEYDV